jgi:CheY-like chemotaxis protein/HPt (histidine-containing phosphotransfer) domain-containing protein
MKKKVFIELIFVAFLPMGILISYGVINVLFAGADPGLASFFIGSSFLATCLLIYLFLFKIVRPLDEIASNLNSKGSLSNHSALVEVSHAIITYLTKIEMNHKIDLEEIEEKCTALISEARELETTNDKILEENKKSKSDLKQDHEIDNTVIQLCTYHLKTIVGSINKLDCSSTTHQEMIVEEIKNAAESLLFIYGELKDELPSTALENIEIWQLMDDVLGQLAPVSQSPQYGTSIMISDSCPGRLILAPHEFKSLLFQYLLYYFSQAEIENHTVIFVEYKNSNLILNTGNYPYPDISRRRHSLVKNSANRFDQNLVFPAEAAGSWEEPGKGLTAIVVCENHEQRECIINRLRQYGVTVTNDFKSRELHFCVVDDESSQAFKGIKPYMSPGMHLLFLHSSTLYERKNVHHIRNPLEHRELKRLLSQLKTATPVLHRYRILAVDDNESNLHLLKLQLSELGHQVTTANNGEAAIKLYENNHFDLVFLDIQMPGVDGLEVTRRINLIAGHTPPVIGLTAHASNEEKQAYLDTGMDQVLMKPLRIDNLKSILEHHLEREPIQGSSALKTPAIALGPFNYDLAVSRANNRPEIADELFQLLIMTLPGDLAQINQAAEKGMIDELKSSVHRLNGAIRYCGVPGLSSAIEQLETRIKISIDDASSEALIDLNKEVDSLLSWHQRNPNPFMVRGGFSST